MIYRNSYLVLKDLFGLGLLHWSSAVHRGSPNECQPVLGTGWLCEEKLPVFFHWGSCLAVVEFSKDGNVLSMGLLSGLRLAPVQTSASETVTTVFAELYGKTKPSCCFWVLLENFMVMLVSYEIQAIKNKFFFSLIPTHPVLMYLHFSEQKLVLHFFFVECCL